MSSGAIFFAALLLLLGRAAAADEVRLANGDRITGTVGSLAGGTLTLATPNGDLRIPWTLVVALLVEDPILATVADGEPALVTIVEAPAAGTARLQPGGDVALAELTALTRPQPPVTLDGSVNAGFVS
jgi:hypothetical protein